jgi:IclR helix-turn-helix domain
MSDSRTLETVTRFRDILALVSREQVRTAYEISQRLGLPLSSTYRTVADMERLSCLARDESGYLLVGVRPQQIALDALGFDIAAQQLPPLVRHLRDQTGDTAFMANVTTLVTVGAVAIGFNVDHLMVQPFQTYRIAKTPAASGSGGVIHRDLVDESGLDAYGQPVCLAAIELAKSTSVAHESSLVIGVARAHTSQSEIAHIERKLFELKALFDQSREPR